MKKPELVRVLPLEERTETSPFVGGRSACEKVVFKGDDEQELEKQFDTHFRKVHMREDASQAAARIVREATDEK